LKSILIALAVAAAATCSTAAGTDAGAEAEINAVMDRWHRAAADADAAVFFGSMTEEAVYLGTDPAERWTKSEFIDWSKKHFERGSAWEFQPRERLVYFSRDGSVAWFDELLDTWMGTCRGSGVLVCEGGDWKIAHYNLAVTVPNELIQDFIAIFDRPAAEPDAGGD
jgi:hypothetical protein